MTKNKNHIPDYSNYTLMELESIYSRMQKDTFLERTEAIQNEIKIKKEALSKNPSLENLEDSLYNYEYASFGKRVGITFLDSFISSFLYPFSIYVLVLAFKIGSALPILIFSLLVIYFLEIFFVTKFGGTPAKLLLKLRIISSNGACLTLKNAVIRTLPLIIAEFFYFMMFWDLLSVMPENIDLQNLHLEKYVQLTNVVLWFSLFFISKSFIIFDLGTILFNERNRAIHDFWGKCFVVTKNSLDRMNLIKVNLYTK